MTKLYLVGMSGPGSLDNLKELMEPIRAFFDGVVWVLHDSHESPETEYLNAAKGQGAVIPATYCRRHAFSRDHYLYCGPIQPGDWCVQVDDLERLNPYFCSNLRPLIARLETQGVNATYLFGKVFMFQHHESLRYQGSPHEGFARDDGALRGVELSTYYTEAQSRYSVRNQRRQDPFHWLNHYGRYYLEFPWGSNHCLLGNENRGDPMTIFREREALRLSIREYLRDKTPLTVEGFAAFAKANPRDPTLLGACNKEKILNDLYRFYVLDDKTVTDNHTWHDMKTL